MRADHDQICFQIGRQLRDLRGDGVEAHMSDHDTATNEGVMNVGA